MTKEPMMVRYSLYALCSSESSVLSEAIPVYHVTWEVGLSLDEDGGHDKKRNGLVEMKPLSIG